MSKPPRLQKRNEHWYVSYPKNGRSQRDSLRTKDLQTAEVRFQGWLKERRLHIEVQDNPRVEDVLELWMQQWITGRMLSESRYPSICKNLNKYFGRMRVSEIEREHSRTYRHLRQNAKIGTSKASNSTVRAELQRLRAALRFMVERVEPKEQRLPQTMIPYIELPHASPPRNRVLSKDEIQLLRETCPNLTMRRSNRMSRIGRFVMLAMETAQRKTAICELKWDQVKFDLNQIYFNQEGRLQTQKKRPTVPISPVLRPVLERAFEERINDFVIDHSNGVWSPLKKLASDLGIEGLHPHVFRHTWATQAVLRGVPLKKVAMFLGDKEKTVIENYQHLSPDYLEDVFEGS
jgi:integrase